MYALLQSMFSSIMQHRQAQSHTLGVDVLSDQVVAHINADCYYWTGMSYCSLL